MECPKCHITQPDGNSECSRCGIIFRKYRPDEGAPNNSIHLEREAGPEKLPLPALLKNIFFEVDLDTNIVFFLGRTLVFVVLMVWGIKFILLSPADARIMSGFWHLVNTPFHEAGHIIFRLLGPFMTSLGGSLSQVLMPLVCGSVLLLKTRDPFGASFCLWWTGENFMDLAPYINDARRLTLPLLGGNTGETSPYGFHDWEFILTETKLLPYDHAIAVAAHFLGVVLMMLALSWAAILLFKQYRNLKN
jgi:hypothetical protein